MSRLDELIAEYNEVNAKVKGINKTIRLQMDDRSLQTAALKDQLSVECAKLDSIGQQIKTYIYKDPYRRVDVRWV